MAEPPSGARPTGDAPANSIELEHSFNVSGQLPLDALPPEAIDRLRAGGDLTEAEWDMVRSAALKNAGGVGGGGGITARLIGAAISSGALRETTPHRKLPDVREEAVGDSAALVVESEPRTFEWKWEGGARADTAGAPTLDPQTYYELLSGEPDPLRDFFVTARRVLDIAIWVFAIGIPVGLVAVALATRQSAETTFFMGVFGTFIGVMIRKSMPSSPFR